MYKNIRRGVHFAQTRLPRYKMGRLAEPQKYRKITGLSVPLSKVITQLVRATHANHARRDSVSLATRRQSVRF